MKAIHNIIFHKNQWLFQPYPTAVRGHEGDRAHARAKRPRRSDGGRVWRNPLACVRNALVLKNHVSTFDSTMVEKPSE